MKKSITKISCLLACLLATSVTGYSLDKKASKINSTTHHLKSSQENGADRLFYIKNKTGKDVTISVKVTSHKCMYHPGDPYIDTLFFGIDREDFFHFEEVADSDDYDCKANDKSASFDVRVNGTRSLQVNMEGVYHDFGSNDRGWDPNSINLSIRNIITKDGRELNHKHLDTDNMSLQLETDPKYGYKWIIL